ncbi:MAG: LON peptidase substrate-binding domain-containing protein [Microthrixaceae bacterium]
MTGNDAPQGVRYGSGDPWPIPAFPLGTVLLPGQLLVLQVFEPRYRVMLFDLREQHRAQFLVTLIVRGQEVGGGDVRSDVGCLAEVVRSDDQPDGRVLLEVLGVRPLEVLDWMPEDPYPLARVREFAPRSRTFEVSDAPERELAEVMQLDRGIAEMLTTLGVEVPAATPMPALLDDLIWQVALRNPLGTLDRQHLLAEADPLRRLGAAHEMLAGQLELLRARGGR